MGSITIAQRITLAHGNGGRRMRALIEEVFASAFGATLDTQVDAAPLPALDPQAQWLMTTDGFTVEPLEFPGGNIGSLAVYGTVNDLAVSGAIPRYLSLNVFIEEGLEIAQLQRITHSLAQAAQQCGVQILAGDTKVLRRGQGGGLYLATTGLGQRRPEVQLGLAQIQCGDVLLSSGTLGEHGAAVLLAREQFGLSGTLHSDVGNVTPVAEILLAHSGLRFMRDPTRGGLTTVAHDIASATQYTVRLFEEHIPLHPTVRSVCELLGYDPYYLASEGRLLAVLSAAAAPLALAALHAHGYSAACIIGNVETRTAPVILQTRIGGERLLPELEDDPLPRIC